MTKNHQIFFIRTLEIIILLWILIIFPLNLNASDFEKAISANTTWTSDEKMAWLSLCNGEIAFENYKGKLRPKLRADFLRDVLLNPIFSGYLGNNGVRIVNADIIGKINLSYGNINMVLWLDRCRFFDEVQLINTRFANSLSLWESHFEKDVNLSFANIGNQLNLEGAKANRSVILAGIEISGILFLNKGEYKGNVNLRGARIHDQLIAEDSNFKNGLNLDGITIGGLLFLGGIESPEVNLRGAKIGDTVSIIGKSNITMLAADSVDVKGELIIRNDSSCVKTHIQVIKLRGASIAEIELSDLQNGRIDIDNGHITSNINITKSQINLISAPFLKVDGILEFQDDQIKSVKLYSCQASSILFDATNIQIESSLRFSDIKREITIQHLSKFNGGIDLSDVWVGAIDFSGGQYTSVNLNRSFIHSYLCLGSGSNKAKWIDGGYLTLINAHAGAIEDRQDAWPACIEMDGFTYDCWGAREPFLSIKIGNNDTKRVDSGEFQSREHSWFIKWLKSQDHFSSQPYMQLAHAFQAVGLSSRATQILYEAKERECQNSVGMKRIAMLISKWVTGYGYRYERSIFWSILFIIVGWILLRVSKQYNKYDIPLGFTFSFDTFLPLIRLRDKHSKIDLNSPLRYYFYFHRIIGFVIGSFVVAALAGLR